MCVTELRVQWVLQGQVSGQLGTWQGVRRPGRSWNLCGHGSGRARGLERGERLPGGSSSAGPGSRSWLKRRRYFGSVPSILIPQSPDTEITSCPWLPLWVLCVSRFYAEKQNRATLTTRSTQHLLDNCETEAKVLTLFPIMTSFHTCDVDLFRSFC